MNAALSPATVVVHRTIAASPEELFDAWLDPEAVGIWMRPGAILTTLAKIDARVGGHYEFVMHSESATYPTSGTYRVIDRPHRLVFTWQPGGTREFESVVTVEFLRVDQGTEVVLTHEQLPEALRESHRNGWTSGIEHLDRFACRRAS
jgi:uncharacterized protein YndB with AHSA1/START domain